MPVLVSNLTAILTEGELVPSLQRRRWKRFELCDVQLLVSPKMSTSAAESSFS